MLLGTVGWVHVCGDLGKPEAHAYANVVGGGEGGCGGMGGMWEEMSGWEHVDWSGYKWACTCM